MTYLEKITDITPKNNFKNSNFFSVAKFHPGPLPLLCESMGDIYNPKIFRYSQFYFSQKITIQNNGRICSLLFLVKHHRCSQKYSQKQYLSERRQKYNF